MKHEGMLLNYRLVARSLLVGLLFLLLLPIQRLSANYSISYITNRHILTTKFSTLEHVFQVNGCESYVTTNGQSASPSE
jgi:hypothetical protein